MKNISIHKFVSENYDNKYALKVLYYKIRNTFSLNKLSLKTCYSIKLQDKRFEESFDVFLDKANQSVRDTIALMMSLKALIINTRYIEDWDKKSGIFRPFLDNRFEWVRITSVLVDCIDDDEFYNLFTMLERANNRESFNDDDVQKFESFNVTPDEIEILDYWMYIAKSQKGEYGEVICNNAFVANADFEEYVVNKDIAYIGDTAFCYCSKLKRLIFKREDTQFGKFPIIECPLLDYIIVPDSTEEYYKEQLPYYEDIIFSESSYLELITSQVKEDEDSSGNHFEKIANVFDKVSSSYKYFWFAALLEIVKKEGYTFIPFRLMVTKMASLAWPLCFRYGLDLGGGNAFRRFLEDAKKEVHLDDYSNSYEVYNTLYFNYESTGIESALSPLLKNVPYRFISPWIPFTTQEEVIEKSNDINYGSPYTIFSNNIAIDDSWENFFKNNYDIIKKFIHTMLRNYLLKYNEEVPEILF